MSCVSARWAIALGLASPVLAFCIPTPSFGATDDGPGGVPRLSQQPVPSAGQVAEASSAGTPQANPSVETVTVFGRGELQLGRAAAASAGAVGGADLTTRPVLRVAQLLEV